MTPAHRLSPTGAPRRLLIALCSAVTLALALTQAAASRQPAAAPPVWYRQYPPAPGNPVAIACPTPLICYAAGTDGAVPRTADAGHTWRRETVQLPTGFVVRAIACRTDSVCAASADDRAGSLRTTIVATTDRGQTWHSRYSTSVGGTNGLACPSTGDCVALLHGGAIVTGSEGTARRRRDLPLPTTAMVADGLSCPTPATCFVDARGRPGSRVPRRAVLIRLGKCKHRLPPRRPPLALRRRRLLRRFWHHIPALGAATRGRLLAAARAGPEDRR